MQGRQEIRLDARTAQELEQLAEKLRQRKAAVIREAIRRMAQQEGVAADGRA
jgi:predicted transcriptional regulator